MNGLFTAILTVHGALGLLWVLSSAFLCYAILSSGENIRGQRSVKIGTTMVRAFGGLAIIVGIIVSALLASSSELPALYSVAGIMLVTGIVLAFLTYVLINEGILFRMIRSAELYGRKKILNFSALSLGMVVIIIVLMLAASS